MPTMRARVTVYPRREILDPQGKAIHEALGRLGFADVAAVRAGKSFEVELEAADQPAATETVEQICRQLLANTVVEDYQVEILPSQVAVP